MDKTGLLERKRIAGRILAAGFDMGNGYIGAEVEGVYSIIQTGRANPNTPVPPMQMSFPFVPEEFMDEYKRGLAVVMQQKMASGTS
jgi:hypothetical protein